MKTLWLALWLLAGCATVTPEPFYYTYCKAGIGGEYRIMTSSDPNDPPILALFSVGGPYDKEHILCAISGDHAILDLGKGKAL